jgi:hypothetical protein
VGLTERGYLILINAARYERGIVDHGMNRENSERRNQFRLLRYCGSTTACMFGLTVPPSLLAIADEVIE